MSEPSGAMTDRMFEEFEYLKGKPDLTQKQEVKLIDLKFRFENYDPTALSNGCKMYLMFLYQYLKYGRQYEIKGKKGIIHMTKGNRVEKSSLDLIKRVTGQHLFRYKQSLKNDFLKGQLDVINSKHIEDADKIIDLKNPFSQFNFMKVAGAKEIPRKDNFQMQGYFSMTGKDYGEVYYCLSDFTEDVIEEQRDQMIKVLCPDGIITEQFEDEWAMAENSMRFGHIPDEDRLIMYPVERDNKIIEKIYEKVEFCREWLAEFERKHLKRIADQLSGWQKQLSSE